MKRKSRMGNDFKNWKFYWEHGAKEFITKSPEQIIINHLYDAAVRRCKVKLKEELRKKKRISNDYLERVRA